MGTDPAAQTIATLTRREMDTLAGALCTPREALLALLEVKR